MAGKSLRDEWKVAKAKAEKVLDMKKDVADKQNFGPKLDAYEAEVKAYHKLSDQLARNPDEAKDAAARKKVMAAALAAQKAGAVYLASLTKIEKDAAGRAGAKAKAAHDLSTVLAMSILESLQKVMKGQRAI